MESRSKAVTLYSSSTPPPGFLRSRSTGFFGIERETITNTLDGSKRWGDVPFARSDAALALTFPWSIVGYWACALTCARNLTPTADSFARRRYKTRILESFNSHLAVCSSSAIQSNRERWRPARERR